MTTPILTPPPRPGVAQPPIWPLIVGNNGGWLWVRKSPAQGACGVSGYPCKHPGVDVNGRRGTKVVAPEDGEIVAVANGAAPPFSGYGPWLVIIHGKSGWFHLLSHLDPATSSLGPLGKTVRAGDVVGTVSHANHTHWEVRRELKPPRGGNNFTNNTDPIAWLRREQSSSSGLGTLIVLGAIGITLYVMAR